MRLPLPWIRTRAIFSSGVGASSSRLRKRRGLVMLISMFLSKIFRKLVMFVEVPEVLGLALELREELLLAGDAGVVRVGVAVAHVRQRVRPVQALIARLEVDVGEVGRRCRCSCCSSGGRCPE